MTKRAEPFAYSARYDSLDGIADVAPSLARLQERCGALPDEIAAWYEGAEPETVPREDYAEPNPPTPEEALGFVRRRAARIADSVRSGRDGALWKAMGCLRCNADDPEEKQVADYVASAPWRWRADLTTAPSASQPRVGGDGQ